MRNYDEYSFEEYDSFEDRSDFFDWYDNLPIRFQHKVDDIADRYGIPYYDEASGEQLSFLIDYCESRFRT